jgi:signal transduction histidine kinase
MEPQKKQPRILGIKRKELFAFLLFYYLFATFYRVTLWINSAAWGEERAPLFNFRSYMDAVGIDYMIKAMVTFPIWWLLFRRLRSAPTRDRLLLHILLLPAFVVIWQQLYYVICEAIDFGHLSNSSSVWDIYIPSLFYVLQFGIMHAYNYHLDIQKKLKLEGELRTAALKSELTAIKAQLNPHFLYNVFNTISASVPAKNERTRRMIAELSDLFRYQLKASQVETVPLKEELEFINKYLELEKERFEDRLNIHFDVEKDILNEHIPPMLLQPLVENSIKHGLASLIEGGSIQISIKRKEDKLFFEISDTGVGVMDKEAVFNKGIGLTNTQLRLEKLYQSTLQLSDNSPRGLKISFEI